MKALFITPHDIYNPYGNGGVKATQRNYVLLQKVLGEKNVKICSFPRKEYVHPQNSDMTFSRTQNNIEYFIASLFGCKVYFPWIEKKIRAYIDQLNIDLLFIDSSILGRLALNKSSYKVVVFYHNIETDYAKNKLRKEGIKYLTSYWASKYNDKCSLNADGIICLNTRDANRLEELFGRKADYLLPITFEDLYDEERDKKTEKKDRAILFVGSLCAPNQLSIEWFMKEVVPKLNGIELTIVGNGFEKNKCEYEENARVHVVGSVNELDEYYYMYTAVVMPITYGAGMKVKTAEALMYGRTIFASDEALEGYDVEGVTGIYRCNSAEDYIKKINQYFDGAERYKATDVRNLYLEKYNTQTVEEGFGKYILELLK